jgi:thymidylate synthase (FAD)
VIITKQNVEYVDHMGSDLSVVNAARVSFHKKAKHFGENDAGLLKYLAKHNHWTPFAHAFLSYRIKAPIFVARQLVKHQVGLAWNEVSRRYVDEEPEFYFPDVYHYRPDKSIKQGAGGEMPDDIPEMKISSTAGYHVDGCLDVYTCMLKAGMAPEEARMFLPLNTMTEWIWSGSLAAFSRVCKLRLDPHSQSATREVAAMIKALAEPLFPVSWKALEEV